MAPTGGFELDTSHPQASIAVAAPVGASGPAPRFVQFRLRQLANPFRLGLSFEVLLPADDGSTTRLGGFSPYPADRPGRFIVPTFGRVTPGTRLIVRMTVTDPQPEGALIDVWFDDALLTDR